MAPVETALKSLVDLKGRECHFVCEEPSPGQREWLYCGKPAGKNLKGEASPYCKTHHAIVYDPPKAKKTVVLRPSFTGR